MLADLHTHTSRSDGVLAPGELVRQARAAGLECIALTDHDSLAGVEEALAAGSGVGLRVIAGVELSVRDAERNDEHLLGWFIDPSSAVLQAYLAELQDSRRAMAAQTLKLLAGLGVPVSAERVAELAAGAVVTRPHIARAMVEAGHVGSEREAFERYLGTGQPASAERPSPSPERAIGAIRSAGGVAGLAHPVFEQDGNARERRASVAVRVDRLAEQGLAAVECFYPDASDALRVDLARLAATRGLVATGGTDYHGPEKAPFAPLGTVTAPPDTVQALERLARP
jgi:predicted metal-dependent phosphoesterase TrpH